MTKPDRGKTKTIKQRSVYVYLPSTEMVQDWKKRAESAQVPISKFVMERVEDSIRREGESGYLPRVELIKSLQERDEELKQLRKENTLLRQLTDNLDRELRSYRAKPFLDEEFRGTRKFDQELVNLLKSGSSYSGEELLARLGLEPSESDLVKAVSKQLEILEKYGLVEFNRGAWRWRK